MDDQPVTLWTLERDGEEIGCRVRLMPYGIEVDVLTRGTVVATRVFETDAEALAWADARRQRKESDGWKLTENTQASGSPPIA